MFLLARLVRGSCYFEVCYRYPLGMAPIHIAVEKNDFDIVSKLAKCPESINVQVRSVFDCFL